VSIIEKVVDKQAVDGRPEPEERVSQRLGAKATATESGDAYPADDLHPESETTGYSELPPSIMDGDAIQLLEAATSEAPRTGTVDVDADIRFADLNLEGLLSSEGGRSRAAEEYRMIKRPLLVRAVSGRGMEEKHPNLIMITSALSGEGKTFTSINLAISIAMEMDRTVLLIDSDLAKPKLSRMLEINDRPGFTECLKDEKLDLGQYILNTDVPKLKILPAGHHYQRSTELLASNTMQSRLTELALRYSDRIVLFDSPPLLATSEASALARNMGQVAVVVEFGSTPQYMVNEALALLPSPESASLILNKIRDDFLGMGASGYGYGYGYGYGKGYGYGSYGDK